MAAGWKPVQLTRGLDLTLQQAVAANTAPKIPAVIVRLVPDPTDETHGLVIVGVPRSPVAPHALLVSRERLAYPVLNDALVDDSGVE